MNTQIIRFLFGTTIALATALLLLVIPMPAPARAGGSVTTCTEAGLDAALSGGGMVMFNCGGTNSPATIILTSQKTITAPTTIDGGSVITLSGGNSTPLFLVNSGVTLTLNAITITQGHTSGNGGCLYVNGILALNDATVTNCIAAGASSLGGGFYVNSTGRATLVNSRVSSSTAAAGGGISNSGTLTLTNVTLSGNSGNGGTGGGISNSGTLTLTNVTLSGNYATYGGGGISNSGTLTLTNVTLSGNSGGFDGGGIRNDGTATLTNVTLSRNQATGTDAVGGGIYNYIGATATLTNVTLSRNSATYGGGGIYNYVGMATLTNVTLSGNSATVGGGIAHFGASTALTNTIVANNSGGNCGPALGGSFNLSSDGTCGFGAGRDNINVMLAPLGNYGGPTLTHMLKPSSPAVDFGTNTGCPSDDQRGKSRPVNGTCDVGAVERQPVDFSYWLNLPLILK